VLAGEHAGEFHTVDLLHQGRQELAHLGQSRLVLPFVTQFDQNLQVVNLATGCAPVVDQLDQRGAFSQDLLGALVVVPEIRLGNFGFQFTDPLAFTIDVKDTSSAHRAFPGVASGFRFLHGTCGEYPLCAKCNGGL
jgi:hypothetical protein